MRPDLQEGMASNMPNETERPTSARRAVSVLGARYNLRTTTVAAATPNETMASTKRNFLGWAVEDYAFENDRHAWREI
jgi:hypothetical protein